MKSRRVADIVGGVGLAVFLAFVSPLVGEINPRVFVAVIVVSFGAMSYGAWRFALDLWKRQRAIRFPPGDDIGLLQTYINAEDEHESLDEAGKRFAEQHDWNLEAHGRAVLRLLQDRFVEADVMRDGMGRVNALYVRAVTGAGRRAAGIGR